MLYRPTRSRLHASGRATLVASLLPLTIAFWWPGAWAVAASEREFTPAEQARLRAGELVQRPATERRGRLHLMGGTSFQVVDAPRDVVWQALVDTEHYSKMLPQVLEARLVQDRGAHRLVYLRQGQQGFVETAYYLDVDLDQQRGDIAFRMDSKRPHDLRAAYGFYSVRPFESGRTLLCYGIMADIGEGVLRSLLRGAVQEWMLKTPWMVKRFVEGSGRWIYDWPATPSAAKTPR